MATGDNSIYLIEPTPLTLRLDDEDNNQGLQLLLHICLYIRNNLNSILM